MNYSNRVVHCESEHHTGADHYDDRCAKGIVYRHALTAGAVVISAKAKHGSMITVDLIIVPLQNEKVRNQLVFHAQ